MSPTSSVRMRSAVAINADSVPLRAPSSFTPSSTVGR
jgi:hypothetical protein